MPKTSDRSEVPAAIQTHITAIFISLELSRKVWLVTSLSPGAGEKMSKHCVPAGDVAALLLRFAELKRKAQARGTYQNVLKTRIFVDPFGSRVGSSSDDVSPVASCDRLAEQMDYATLGIWPSFWTLSK